jgi:predicted negative regulator of RcsB-dependent stress response
MAVYDLEEQEKLDEIKHWWKRWGNTLIAALIGFVAVFAGIQTWKHYQRSQAEQAATLYEGLEKSAKDKDTKKILDGAKAIVDKYASTAYAPRAALIAAKASFEAGDLATAETQLRWVIGNAKETQLQELGRLRLASVLGDEKKFDEALQLLDANKDPSFAGATAALKGDILAAQGKSAEARSAYQSALAKADAGVDNQTLQIKLDALGESK